MSERKSVMKISIIFYSETGNTEKVAWWVAEGARSVSNAEVRLFNIKDSDTPDKDYIESSDAIVFGTPTYVANMCWQLKKWFDTRMNYNMAGKLGAAFATENSPFGGGGELAITTVITHMLVKGMLVYSSGCSCGQPYIHIGPTIVSSQIDERKDLCITFGERVASQCERFLKKER